MRHGHGRNQGNRLLRYLYRPFGAVSVDVQRAQTGNGERVLGVDGESFLVTSLRLGVVVAGEMHNAQVIPRSIAVGVDFDGLFVGGNRLIELAEVLVGLA